MKKNLDLTDFTYLLLATLAKKNIRYGDIRNGLNNQNIKAAVLPLYYKEVIERILCEPNRWKYMFSVLIDMDDYFNDHFIWELKFSRELDKVVGELNKKMIFDLEFDQILIKFSNEEIEEILAKYSDIDDDVKKRLDHFAILLNDEIFKRPFTEKFYRNRNFTAIHLEEIEKYNKKNNVTEEVEEDYDEEEENTKRKRRIRIFRFL